MSTAQIGFETEANQKKDDGICCTSLMKPWIIISSLILNVILMVIVIIISVLFKINQSNGTYITDINTYLTNNLFIDDNINDTGKCTCSIVEPFESNECCINISSINEIKITDTKV